MTDDTNADLARELAAFEAMRSELEAKYNRKWVVFYNAAFVAAFDSFDSAATEAVSRFGSGPYLIKQVGALPIVMPASVMYHVLHA